MVRWWSKRIRWVVPWALIGAVGCSKIDRSRDAGGTVGAQTGEVPISLKVSDFEKVCHELPNMSEVPVMVNAQMYPKLVEFIRDLSPLLKHDKERFLKAHGAALKIANENVMRLLKDSGKLAEYTEFKRRTAEFISYDRPNQVTDLQTMLSKVMEVSQGSRCGGAYLAHFYTRFIKELDAFGSITFGLTEDRSAENTLLVNFGLPDEIRLAPPTRLQGRTAILTLPMLQRSPVVDEALRWLERSHASREFNAILFDLRNAGGVDVGVINQIRASASRGWGTEPVVIWTNRETRGAAAVMTDAFSTQPNVMIVSADPETYGYGRKLEQRSAILMPGLSPMTLTMGVELLQVPTLDPHPDGFRFRLREGDLVPKASTDKVVELSQEWVHRKLNGDVGLAGIKGTSISGNSSVRLTASGETTHEQRGEEASQPAQPQDSAPQTTNPFAQAVGDSQSAAPSPTVYEQDPTMPPGWSGSQQ